MILIILLFSPGDDYYVFYVCNFIAIILLTGCQIFLSILIDVEKEVGCRVHIVCVIFAGLPSPRSIFSSKKTTKFDRN